MRLIRLEVRVDVLLAVFGIDEAVKPVACHVVVVHVHDMDGHLAADGVRGKRQAIAVPGLLYLLAVDLEALDRPTSVVEKERLVAGCSEANRDIAAIGRLTRDEIETYVVRDVAHARGAGGCLSLGQNVSCRRLAGKSCNL